MKTQLFKNSVLTVLLATLTWTLTSCNSQPSTGNSSESQKPQQDIHGAVIAGNLEAVKQHIAAGSNLNEPDPFGGSSPLITASLFGKEDIVKALLDAGVQVNFKNNEGSTALHTAAFFCEKEIVQLLLANGADKTITNKYGATPLASIQGPFEDVKGIYVMMEKQLSPMGFSMDLAQIEAKRPEVAALLQ